MTDRKSLPIIDAAYRLAMETNQTRQSFAWRLEDHLPDLSDALLAQTYVPREAPIGYHSTSSGNKIPVLCLEDLLVLRALKTTHFRHGSTQKSTRCNPTRTRVAASSHTSVNHVEPKKQSTLDATVASARIVARITQINGGEIK